ncbi:MAG: globin [Halopseudomonas sp.]
MDYEQIFDQSFERCRHRTTPQPFFRSFYSRYLASDPQVAKIFKNTDMQQQEKMLEKSFYRLLTFYATNSSDDYIEHIAIRHNRNNLNITQNLYDLWLEELIKTVTEYDPLCDDNIELAWRLVFSPGITYMKYKYDH